MIVARAPLRFSLGGGGSDLPAYAREHGGFVVSAAIDAQVWVTARPRIDGRIRVVHEAVEIADRPDDLAHPIYREALRQAGVDRAIDLTSVSDVPPGSGLGGSGAFTVALLAALHAHRGDAAPPDALAEQACHLEQHRLGEPSGKQDPYIAAFGGVTALTVRRDGAVEVEPVPLAAGVRERLEDRLVVAHTGVERRSREVLSAQARALRRSAEGMHRIKQLGHEVYDALIRGDIDGYGELLHEHWSRKRALAEGVSDPRFDAHYEAARAAGAVGGKLMGAGGGGLFMFYTIPATRDRVAETLEARGLRIVPFRFDDRGAGVAAHLR